MIATKSDLISTNSLFGLNGWSLKLIESLKNCPKRKSIKIDVIRIRLLFCASLAGRKPINGNKNCTKFIQLASTIQDGQRFSSLVHSEIRRNEFFDKGPRTTEEITRTFKNNSTQRSAQWIPFFRFLNARSRVAPKKNYFMINLILFCFYAK